MKIVTVDWIDVTKKTSDDSFDVTYDIDNRLSNITTIGWLYRGK